MLRTSMYRAGRMLTAMGMLIAVTLIGVAAPPVEAADTGPGNCPNNAPTRSRTGPDGDGDGNPDFTVALDQCRQRTFDIGDSEKTIRVYWTSSASQTANNLVSQDVDGDGTNDPATATVDELIAWTETAWRQYRSIGFGDPMGSARMEVHVFDIGFNNSAWGTMGWCCSGDPAYEFDALQLLRTTATADDYGAAIAFHEMFHAVAWSGNYGGWVNEATASVMEDKLTLPVDVGNTTYMGRVQSFLSGRTQTPVDDLSYDAALLWTYVLERLGTTTGEPRLGSDAMLDFWQNPADNDFQALGELVDRLSGGALNLSQLWRDFTVANWAHQYAAATTPAKYRYADSGQNAGATGTGFTYPTPPPTLDIALGAGAIQLDSLQPWSAKYYRMQPQATTALIDIDIRQDSSAMLDFTVLGVRGGDIVREISERGRDFTASMVNDAYDEVILIVTAGNQLANFRMALGAPDPVLDIVSPTTASPAQAGPADAPGKVLAKVRVLSDAGGGAPVTGVDPTDFDIQVGGITVADSAVLSTSGTVAGDYWLLFEAPAQTADGLQPLSISLGAGLTDTNPAAVRYGPVPSQAAMMVVDRSGSMGDDNKMDAAKRAASIYTDSYRAGDKIGLASFANDASVDRALGDWSSGRGPTLTAIDGLTPSGATAIGAGLAAGMGQVVASGGAGSDWSLVLLSDGLETSTPTIDDFLDTFKARQDAGDQVPVVHAVALGPDADRANLERVSAATGGEFHFASAPPASGASMALDNVDAGTSTELVDVYRSIHAAQTHQQRLRFDEVATPAEQIIVKHPVRVEPSARRATFVADLASAGKFGSVFLTDPNGAAVGGVSSAGGHYVWTVDDPMPGIWTINADFRGPIIESLPDDGPEPHAVPTTNTYLIEAAVESTTTLDVIVPIDIDHPAGRPVPLRVVFTEGTQPVGESSVDAVVIAPNGAVNHPVLRDDGLGDDAVAGDGEYSATLPAGFVAQAGAYRIGASATGVLAAGQPVERETRAAFNLDAGADTDGDGLPDWWELEWGTDPAVDDHDDDPDHDGLTTLDEWNLGTDPLADDTDGDGEGDGSEVDHGSDPLDPGDGAVECPANFTASQSGAGGHGHDVEIPGAPTDPDGAVLRFAPGEATSVRVFRAATPAGPPVLLTEVPAAGKWVDESLAVGSTAAYWVQLVRDGHIGCLLGPEVVTMVADPVGPDGQVVINDDQPSTGNPAVRLSFGADPGTTEMRVSNAPDFADAEWEPYTTTKAWTIEPRPDGSAAVYAEFREASGAVGPTSVDTIVFDASLDSPDPFVVPVDPGRVVDTRPGGDTVDGEDAGDGRVAAGDTIEVVIAGRAGVPADAAAAFLNVTSVQPSGNGFVTVYPCGSDRPLASNVNYLTGSFEPNAVLAKLGDDGKVCLYTLADTHLVVDVNGYVPRDAAPIPINPKRILDTRPDGTTVDGDFVGTGRVAPRTTFELPVAGRGGVPANASAAFLNVTSVQPSGNGFVTVYPCGSNRPLASNVNYLTGSFEPNAVLAKLGDDGKVCLYTLADTDLVVDVNGYVPAAMPPIPLEPARVLDSRPDGDTVDGDDAGDGRVAAGDTIEVVIAGRAGVPADAAAAFLNVTSVQPSGNGFVTVYPCGSDRPLASNVNYLTGSFEPNAVLAKLGDDGKVCLYTLADTHLVVDVNGYSP